MNWHLLARASYLLLCLLLVIWGVRSQASIFAWLIWIAPPIVGLRFIWRGDRQRMMFAAFFLIIPFCHGVMLLVTGSPTRFAWLESGLSLLFFVSFFLAFRPNGQARDNR